MTMKKNVLIIGALALSSIISCQKEMEISVMETGRMTFEASIPDITKTAVDADMNVLWSEGDLIDVYGYTQGQDVAKAVFELQSGAGTKSAKFSLKDGETLGEFDSYFAVYPSGLAIKTVADKDGESVLPDWITIKSTIATYTEQAVVENGYDPAQAIMVARVTDGKLQFTHGVCYFRIRIPEDGITKVKVTAASNAFQKRPAYSAADGSIVASNSGVNEIRTIEGTFVKDSYYYLAAIPRNANTQKLNGITVTYTHNGIEKSVVSTADKIKNLYPEIGKVYDLGCPPLVEPVPVIDVKNSQIEAAATGGSLSYTIENEYPDGNLTAVVSTSKTTTIGDFTILDVIPSSIPFSCSENTEATTKYAYVTLTYTYDGGKTVTAEGVVSQAGVSSGDSEDYVWDFSSDAWQAQLAAAGSKNTDITNWNMSLDGLTWNSKSKSKWNTATIDEVEYYYIQAGGASKINDNDRVFTFTTKNSGTVTIKCSNTGGSADNSRMVCVKDSSGNADQSQIGGFASTAPKEVEFSVAAGEVKVYCTGNALRFHKIEFHSTN